MQRQSEPEPLVCVGDHLSISWPICGGDCRRFDAEVIGLQRLEKRKKGSWYKYKLILNDGDTVSTTLSNREWHLIESPKTPNMMEENEEKKEKEVDDGEGKRNNDNKRKKDKKTNNRVDGEKEKKKVKRRKPHSGMDTETEEEGVRRSKSAKYTSDSSERKSVHRQNYEDINTDRMNGESIYSRGILPPHKYICAPMVGASELAFRLLCRRYGVELAYTPMINRCHLLIILYFRFL